MNHNKCRWRKSGKKFNRVICMKTVGYFMEKLHYLLEGLNLKEKIMLCRSQKCWPYGKANTPTRFRGARTWLDIRAADVWSEGMGTSGASGIALMATHLKDVSIQTNWGIMSLVAGKPKGSQINFWVYLRVFGIVSWAVFVSLLAGFVLAMATIKEMSSQGSEVSKFDNILSGIATAYYYTFQLGEHHDERRHRGSTTVLTLTLSLLTMFIWIYYTGDIIAEMTSGPGPHPVNNFDDVLTHDYEVVAQSFYGNQLKSAKSKAQRDVYNLYLRELKEGQTRYSTKNFRSPLSTAYKNPRKLAFAPLNKYAEQNSTMLAGLTWLKIDEKSRTHAGFVLQQNSEFKQCFNHYIMKMMEGGILKRLQKKWLYGPLYVNEEFSLAEPEPLSFSNVLFLFNVLGVGIVASIGIFFVEWTQVKWHRWRNPQVPLVLFHRTLVNSARQI